MAHDEDLAARVREVLRDVLRPGPADERRMFGGLAFLLGGHLALAVSGEGGLMVRCAPDDTERLLGEPGASPMVMRGRELTGWLRVDAVAVADSPEGDAALERWVRTGTAYAGSLAPR